MKNPLCTSLYAYNFGLMRNGGQNMCYSLIYYMYLHFVQRVRHGILFLLASLEAGSLEPAWPDRFCVRDRARRRIFCARLQTVWPRETTKLHVISECSWHNRGHYHR